MQFNESFFSLTGNAPYSWQLRLFDRLASGGSYDALDIPTGLGKTSIIQIWLLSHLLGDDRSTRPPMRLVYVVNRRTIVDQATSIAEQLWPKLRCSSALKKAWNDRFPSEELAVSTLRGAKADNGQWLLTPHSPAIIIGTVDMIGSRLLFNAYRAGRWQRSRHAGLLGQDSLIVHDEAHLSEPFQRLLEWILDRQSRDCSPRPMKLIAMSATAAGDEARNVLRLDHEDGSLVTVQRRLRASKTLRFLTATNRIAAQLARLAFDHDRQPAARVIVFVRDPRTAQEVVGTIKALHKKERGEELSGNRIELLTGTIRGYERDKLVGTPVLTHLLESFAPVATEYLIATSAGEIGADFDANHLVCDLTTIDSFIQRAGRVNRRGSSAARIDLVLDVKRGPKLSSHEEAMAKTAQLLTKLPSFGDGAYDASPKALRELRERNSDLYELARAPRVPAVTPHEATLDAWSLTSIDEEWPLAHDVEPYLHGVNDPQPQTSVAWRSELDLIHEGGETTQAVVSRILSWHPLQPQELLRDRPQRIAELLIAIRGRSLEKPLEKHLDRSVVLIVGRRIEVMRMTDLEEDPHRLAQQISNVTLVLPASVGGLVDGIISPESNAPATDVADPEKDRGIPRARILLTRNDEGRWRATSLSTTSRGSTEAPGNSFETWTNGRNELASQLGMRYVGRVVLASNEDGASQVLLLFRDIEQKRKSSERLTIEDHNEQVRLAVERRVKGLRLSSDLEDALSFAARQHDLGKGWSSKGAGSDWQRAIANTDEGISFAKSFVGGMSSRILDRYRHEFGSLLDAAGCTRAEPADLAVRDLALHLISSHHGRARPHFVQAAMRLAPGTTPDPQLPQEVAVRFDRLQRRFGHWGLAWLESLLMSADAEASRDLASLEGEDVEEEA